MAIILDAKGLNKSFGAVTAASDINAAIEQDAVVGLIGLGSAFALVQDRVQKPIKEDYHVGNRNSRNSPNR